ncbi:serine/threonine protein kinase [Gordonia sp. HY002]|uniref:serine/threonine protein kinase n=1 Tax=Gordonia zhenghanii TaxID=2911516 RepID=UPI001EF11A21|nr:serine/threonine protein kinase [Gordonia zhenghanii]MCF8571630.1 serine/threonine protein kinase [Gordonia zhenghanii]MCF8602227.1 serine/threonine protein kinase [Gordonia zhenghanii]
MNDTRDDTAAEVTDEDIVETGTAQAEPERTGTAQASAADAARAKKEKKKAKRAAELEAARRDAVEEARADWERAEPGREGPKASVGSRVREHLNPRRHPVICGIVVVCIAALVATTVLAVAFTRQSGDLDSMRQLDQDKATAQNVAGKYAVGAATFKADDLPAWSAALKKGTAPELNSRFDTAVQTLTPLIQEVQWSQTAELIAATTVDVRADRQFVVQVFVSTAMTSTQNPDGLNTVTPYTVTLDRDEDWQITDVAGIGGVAQDGSTGQGTPNLTPNGGQPAAPKPAP